MTDARFPVSRGANPSSGSAGRSGQGRTYRAFGLHLLAALALLGVAACSSSTTSSCLNGAPVAASASAAAPTVRGEATDLVRAALPSSDEALVGIDGSGSMLGFLGSGSGEWQSMLQALKLAITAQNLKPRPFRVGGSNATVLASLEPATNRCFFSGCEGFAAVSSSLDTLWTVPVPAGKLPIRLMLSDLEVNDNDVNSLVTTMRADVSKGAAIGVLGVKMPFNGTVYDSKGNTIHTGRASRPLYLLASGDAAMVRQLLEATRENISLRGVPTQDLHISLLGNQGQETLLARSSQGTPTASVNIGVPVVVGTTTYEPGRHPDMQLLRLLPDNRGIRISSAAVVPGRGTPAPTGLVSLSPMETTTVLNSGISLQSLEVSGSTLTADLRIDPSVTGAALRLSVPAGSLPQEWWLLWNRTSTSSPQARDQTDGLLLAMTKLGQAITPPAAAPAALFCVVIGRGEAAASSGQGGAVIAVLVAALVVGLLGTVVVQQIRQAQDESDEVDD